MPARLKAAQTVLEEIVPRLNDLSRELTPDELRGYVVRLRAEQKHADSATLPKVFSAIGQASFLLGDLPDALDAMKNAARYDDTIAIYWNNLACCQIERGELRQALESIKKARTRTFRSKDEEVVVACTHAEALYRTGGAAVARPAFREMIGKCDPARASDWFHAADTAASLGWDDDAIELLARSIAIAGPEELGDTPAFDYVRAHPDFVRIASFRSKKLGAALARALARTDESADVPELSARVELTEAERVQLDRLLDNPPPVSEALRRVFDDSPV